MSLISWPKPALSPFISTNGWRLSKSWVNYESNMRAVSVNTQSLEETLMQNLLNSSARLKEHWRTTVWSSSKTKLSWIILSWCIRRQKLSMKVPTMEPTQAKNKFKLMNSKESLISKFKISSRFGNASRSLWRPIT